MSTRTLPLVLLALILGGCSRVQTPNLQPSVAQPSLGERIDRADVILIARTRLVRSEGNPAPGTPALQLRKVVADVENVLKGPPPAMNPVTFYYFESVNRPADSSPLEQVQPAQRSIFFLKRDGRYLRAVNDMYASAVPVLSGQHPGMGVNADHTLQDVIAEILILPGMGPDLGYFQDFERTAAIAKELIGDEKTIALLRVALNSKNGGIRSQACLQLAKYPDAEGGCLRQIAADETVPEADRNRANELLTKPPESPAPPPPPNEPEKKDPS